MESQISSSAALIKFKFDRVKTPPIETKQIYKMHNLCTASGLVRCFTPIMDIISPGFSPILNLAESPLDENKKYRGINNSKVFVFPSPVNSNIQTHSEKRSKQQIIGNEIFAENNSFELVNLSTSQTLESFDNSPSIKNIKSPFSLDHNLNVTLLLKDIGLDHYSEHFAKAGIDLEAFLKIKQTDLQNIGIQSDEHCKLIMEIAKDLNTL